MSTLREEFTENGYVVIKGVFEKDELDEMEREARGVIAQQLQAILGRDVDFSNQSAFEGAMVELAEKNVEALRDLGAQVRQSALLQRVSKNQKILDLLQRLGWEPSLAKVEANVRFDSRLLSKTLAKHDASPFLQTESPEPSDFVNVWFPLASYTAGSENIKLGRKEIFAERLVTDSQKLDKAVLDKKNEEELDSVELEVGDVVIYSTYLRHQSTDFKFDPIQWSIQLRYNRKDTQVADSELPLNYVYSANEEEAPSTPIREHVVEGVKEDQVKVTVAILTYNQKDFIGKAIESAVSQVTNFRYEVLVGDDLSTDGTREIILDYQRRYPDKVIPIFHAKNLGQNGFFNTVETLKFAKGKYVAPMDGDDYWTDTSKLQIMADHLDQHPEESACFHNALVTHDDGSPSYELNTPDQARSVGLSDLIGDTEVWFIATSAVLFKGDLMYYPEWFRKSSSGDIPRYIILAKQGPIGYVPRLMSVYRKNRGGVSNKDHYRDTRFLRNRIMMYEGIDRETDYKYTHLVRKNVARYYRMMLDARQYSKSYFRKACLALKYLWMRKPSAEECKWIVREYVVPQWMLNIYSFFALLPHKLRQSSGD